MSENKTSILTHFNSDTLVNQLKTVPSLREGKIDRAPLTNACPSYFEEL